jgi:membrane fusion protein, macrolide-specific efflux system
MSLKSRNRARILLFVIGLIGLSLAGIFLKQQLFPDKAASIMTAVVSVNDIEEAVLATGILKPVKLVAVGAQVSGRMTSLKVSAGQTIGKGDLIAEIDSLTQQNALRTSRASLANIRAQRLEKQVLLRGNELTLSRQKTMVAQKAVSQAEFESAETGVNTIRAQIEALDAQITEAEVGVETAEANLSYTRITAPISGTVLLIVTQEGQTVNAVQSTPTIVILGQLNIMTVRAEISEADILKVKPGQEVYFTILGNPDHHYEATLESIEPAPESVKSDSSFSSSSSSTTNSSSAVYYNGIFSSPNMDGNLKTYMTAEVHIVINKVQGVLTIPSAALGKREGEGKYVVRVVDEGENITSRKIDVGVNNSILAEVVSGLKAGERVVTGEIRSETSTTTGPIGPPSMGL